MPTDISLKDVWEELNAGMQLPKCLKCGCILDTLTEIDAALTTSEIIGKDELQSQIRDWRQQMQPIKYACLGCAHCFPAVATNYMNQTYPDAMSEAGPACNFEVREHEWPVVAGDYHTCCDGEGCPVAVSTLASVEFADQLASVHPPALCIVGKTETENIGIDKVVKNTITNPTIHYLILAGQDPQGHYPGQTLLSLSANGVDQKMRVIGSKGKRPILRNVSHSEINQFRQQIQIIDLIGCEDVNTIISTLEETAQQPLNPVTSCCAACQSDVGIAVSSVPIVEAREPSHIELDKMGYFVIIPQATDKTILVEHYSYDNQLLRVVQGDNARTIYWTIIENDWVSQLSHAAYLGKELAKAELSLMTSFKYVQDGA